MLGVVRGGTGAPSGMRPFPLLFNVFFAAILLFALERFSKDADIFADLIHLQEQLSKVSPETVLECVRRAIWGTLYADDACIVPRSSRGLGRMMAVFVEVFGIFSLTISESKTEIMCMRIPRATGNVENLQRQGATVPPDSLLHLFGRHRDWNPKPVR